MVEILSVSLERDRLSEVIKHFSALEDPRSMVNRRHPLVSVVVIAVMGILGGSSGPTAIAAWANLHFDRLRGVLDLPNGVPQKDVYRRVLSALKPGAFQDCFADWLTTLRARAAQATGITQPILAVDGKTLRRSHDRANGLGALHSVSVWAADFGLTLGQIATDEKSNEITAIPELLQQIDIAGAIVTIDAMGTQTAIADVILAGEADYLLALKKNQPTLYEGVVNYVDEHLPTDFGGIKARRHVTHETGHGRQEQRIVIQMPVPKDLAGLDRWPGLKTIGVVMLMSVCQGQITYDTRYFISSLGMGVKRFAHAVRSHWGIENSCHWVLDVVYREDDSRTREVVLRENLAWLNRFTLSLLKQHPNGHSLAMQRRRCGWNFDVMLDVLTGNRT